MVMSLGQHRRAWEDLGRIDPLWAVLTSPTRRHGRWDPAEFFATGEREIAALMETANTLRLPHERKVVLDFGCGVGRLTRALASHFENYIGVDISEPMLAHAREWHADCTRCGFVLNVRDDLQILESASVDLIYTRYVLQHLPSKALVQSYLREFVRILSRNGLLVFQLPRRIGLLHRLQPRRRLYTLLRGVGIGERLLLERLGLSPMRMGTIPEPEVERFMTGLGARLLRVERSSDLDQVYFVTR